MPRSQTGQKEQAILAYFTNTPLEIAGLVLSLASGVVRERKAKRDAQVAAGKQAAARASKPAATPAPRKKAKKAKRHPKPVTDVGQDLGVDPE